MRGRLPILLAAAASAASGAAAQPAGQKVTGPIATYWVSAQTQTGFGMPAMGDRAGSPAAMANLFRGGGPAQHVLMLQLGSALRAQGGPSAEHLPPATLGVGPSLPLVTPRAESSRPTDAPSRPPQQFERPRARMLIFWGCGEHARPGQPVVIDFTQEPAGRAGPGLDVLGRGFGLAPAQPPSPGRQATYGEWPNERAQTQVPPQGSLVGDHLVRGNYSPEIRFSLVPGQDFLGPLNLTTNAKTRSGSAQLGWNSVAGAKAYLAAAMGGRQDTVVLWTSSEVQASPFALPDFIGPGDLERLVAAHALMSPNTTTCMVPKEVVDAAPEAMVQLVAYGDEVNFSYPPRPTDPKVTWNRQWQVKVRYRSATGGMLGMAAPSFAEDDASGMSHPRNPKEPQKPSRRDQILRGLGGALGVPVPQPH